MYRHVFVAIDVVHKCFDTVSGVAKAGVGDLWQYRTVGCRIGFLAAVWCEDTVSRLSLLSVTASVRLVV